MAQATGTGMLVEDGEVREEARNAAVSLAHLERQTFGDPVLQREVLTLYRRASLGQIERMKSAASVQERRDIAHSLAGAARGVGAFAVADIATRLSRAGRAEGESLQALREAVRAAANFVTDHLSR